MQANSDRMSRNQNDSNDSDLASSQITDLRNICNAARCPPCMLAWQLRFREVVQLLRPSIPMAVAIMQCIELGEGMNTAALIIHSLLSAFVVAKILCDAFGMFAHAAAIKKFSACWGSNTKYTGLLPFQAALSQMHFFCNSNKTASNTIRVLILWACPHAIRQQV